MDDHVRWRESLSLVSGSEPQDPAYPLSQRYLVMAMRVTLDRHGHRERRDVARIRENVDRERGRVTAIPLRADPEPVRAVEQLLLQRVDGWIRIRRAELPEERFLRESRRLFERPAHADARDQWRTGVGARCPDALEDPVLHALDTLGWRQHPVFRTVLATAALRH